MSFNISAEQKIISNEVPLVLPPQLASILGRTETTVLQQIHYWLQRSKNWVNGLCWVYKTYQQWAEEIPFLSDRTIRRTIRTLEDLGILKSERMESKYWNQRKWYTICYDTLETLIFQRWPNWPDPNGQFGQIDTANLATSYTKTTPIDLKTTDTNPTHHPVKQEINREGILNNPVTKFEVDKELSPKQNVSLEEVSNKTHNIKNTPQFSEEIKIDLDLEQAVKDAIAPAPFNIQLKRVVMEASAEIVMSAVAVVEQSRKHRKVKNPAGLLRKAIEHRWTPTFDMDESSTPQGFQRWFESARAAGLVMASRLVDGKLWVYDKNAQAFLYEEMAQLHPLDSLKQPSQSSLMAESRAQISTPSQTPIDFSNVLIAIDIQLARLGWGGEKVQAFLKQVYGQCNRALLRDEELLDLKDRLQTL